MKFVIISDTHSLHQELDLPDGDVIIHAGDISSNGRKEQIVEFLDWFSKLDYTHKIFIGGNHDIFLDEYPVGLLEILPPNVTYLCNRAYQIGNIKLWGSPTTPDLEGWAFGKNRKDMEEHWSYMPKEIDVLITHTPPYGILDKSSRQIRLGCKDLLQKVKQIKPQYHIFGHIHASYGKEKVGATTFINASNLNSYRGLVNPVMVFEV